MTIGLFPLNLVVFPHTRIPLHIFEPRYKALIQECLERGLEFGINLVEDGHMHPIGCTASIVDVTQRYPDGRMDVVVEGKERFRLLELKSNEHPFAVGEVEVLLDDDVPVDEALTTACLACYNTIVSLVYGPTGPTLVHEELGPRPSFEMATKSGLSLEQKQELLEAPSEQVRLELLHKHLQELVPMMKRAESIQRIVQSDGYIKALS